jgi:aarF domain-containing kinase
MSSLLGLGLGIGMSLVTQSLRRSVGLASEKEGFFSNKDNVERIVSTLTKMRGAALKLGQMLSIQGGGSIFFFFVFFFFTLSTS